MDKEQKEQKEINVTLGERIQKCRIEKGFTRETFAEKISVSPRFLADVERGRVGVSISTLKAIALELNESSDYLMGIIPDNGSDAEKQKMITKLDRIPPRHLKELGNILDSIIIISQPACEKDK